MVRKEVEGKKEKQLKAHKERFQETNASLKMKNLCIVQIPEETKRERERERENHKAYLNKP